MYPKLLIVSGPMNGAVFSVDGATTVGRHPENRIAFPAEDRLVSKHHCVVEPAGDGFLIRDLNSVNGTHVNGLQIAEQKLEHGDRIGIGEHLFVFLMHEDPAAAQMPGTELSEDPTVFARTIDLAREQARYLMITSRSIEEAAGERVANDLSALLRIAQVINSDQGLDELQTTLLRLLFDVIPAERGAILFGQAADAVTVGLSLNRRHRPTAAFMVSRTLLGSVLSTRVGRTANNIPGDADLSRNVSLEHVHSVLCVPLMVREQVTGAIYLDSRDARAIFDDGHLELLTGVAAIAAGPLERARSLEAAVQQNRRLKEKIAAAGEIIGVSRETEDLRKRIARVAPANIPVLILGETGVGKQVVAEAVHRFSDRADGPFVALNCAAIPETLFESELFGWWKGAHDKASMDRKGLIEEANGGTLFLDEIGDMPPVLQVKLFAFLDRGRVLRLGRNQEIPVDVRVVAATNRDLVAAEKENAFRRDLLRRLRGSEIRISPLRERPADIEPLARHFLQRAARRFKSNVRDFSPDAWSFLKTYSWPANAGELEQAINSAVVNCESDRIEREDLPEWLFEKTGAPGIVVGPWNDAVRQAKREIILRAARQSGGDYKATADLLGIHPNNLHKLIGNLSIKDDIDGIRKDRKGE